MINQTTRRGKSQRGNQFHQVKQEYFPQIDCYLNNMLINTNQKFNVLKASTARTLTINSVSPSNSFKAESVRSMLTLVNQEFLKRKQPQKIQLPTVRDIKPKEKVSKHKTMKPTKASTPSSQNRTVVLKSGNSSFTQISKENNNIHLDWDMFLFKEANLHRVSNKRILNRQNHDINTKKQETSIKLLNQLHTLQEQQRKIKKNWVTAKQLGQKIEQFESIWY